MSRSVLYGTARKLTQFCAVLVKNDTEKVDFCRPIFRAVVRIGARYGTPFKLYLSQNSEAFVIAPV